MHIWVDADACPKVIKEILFRAATRTGIPLTLVANQTLHALGQPERFVPVALFAFGPGLTVEWGLIRRKERSHS